MKSSLWLSWKELLGRKTGLFLNAALVALAVAFYVNIELAARFRDQAVKSRLYHIAPSIKIFPAGVTQDLLLRSDARATIDQGMVPELEYKYAEWIYAAGGRLIFKRKINRDETLVIGYDPGKTISPFKTLRNLLKTEVCIGSALGQRNNLAAGGLISVDSSVFKIKEVLPSTGTFDDAAVFMTLPAARSVSKMKNSINEISLYLKTGVPADALIKKLRDNYPDLNIFPLKSGDAADEKIESALTNYRFLLYGVTGLVTITCLFISAFVNAHERKLEVATLYAIGASNTGVLAVVAGRSVIVGILGSAAGSLSGAIFALFQNYNFTNRAAAAGETYLIAIITAVIFSVLAALPVAAASAYRNHVQILQEALL